jgi:hypothetical protein
MEIPKHYGNSRVAAGRIGDRVNELSSTFSSGRVENRCWKAPGGVCGIDPFLLAPVVLPLPNLLMWAPRLRRF